MTDPTALRRQLERAYGRVVGVAALLAMELTPEGIKLAQQMIEDALAELEEALLDVAREMTS